MFVNKYEFTFVQSNENFATGFKYFHEKMASLFFKLKISSFTNTVFFCCK